MQLNPTRILTFFGILALLSAIQCAHQPENGPNYNENLMANLDLFVELTRDGLETQRAHLTNLDSMKVLVIASQQDHEADWLIKNAMTTFVLDNFEDVVVHSDSLESDAARLEFRIVKLDVRYVRQNSWLPFSEHKIERNITVAVNATLVGSDGRTISTFDFRQKHTDTLAEKRIIDIETEQYEFTHGDISVNTDWMYRFEPFFAITMVGGLVYLFYSSRND